MPTRIELDNLIATNLADNSNIVPSEHRAVETAIADYVDEQNTLIQSSLGIYIKDNDLVIPNAGTFVNGLDFAGATTSYLELLDKSTEYALKGYFGSTSNPIDIGPENSTYAIISSLEDVITSSKNTNYFNQLVVTSLNSNTSNFRFNLKNPIQIPDWGDWIISFTTQDGINGSTIRLPVISNIDSTGVDFVVRESDVANQTISRVSISYTAPAFGLEYERILHTGIDLSVGGVFDISPTDPFFVFTRRLQNLSIVIEGGATPGIYKIF